MPGFSNLTGSDSTVFAGNVSFDGTERGGVVNADGQFLIGSSVAPHIRVNSITSTDSSVTITPGHGTCDLSVASSGSTTYSEDSGTATPSSGTLNIQGGTSTGGAATNINTVGSGATASICLNNSITQPTANSAKTQGVYSLGSDYFMHNYSGAGLGGFNTFLGTNCGNFSNGAGCTTNTGVGAASMYSLTSGYSNTCCGFNTLFSLTSGSENTAIGYKALTNQTTSNYNTAVGFNSCASINTGDSNTCVGLGTLQNATTGTENTAIGFASMQNINGSNNTAIGGHSMIGASGATAATNTAIGFESLQVISSGIWNACVGDQSCQQITTGQENTAIGHTSLFEMTTGSYNIALGSGAGSSYASSESSNLVISNAGVVGESNTIRIGTQGSGGRQQNTCYIAGIEGVSVATPQHVMINPSTGQLGSQAINAITTWSPVSTSQALVPGVGYYCTAGAALSFSLPATAAAGTQIGLCLAGATSWTITQGAGQSITVSPSTSTPGVGGSISSLTAGSNVTLLCTTANTQWTSISSQGTITVI